ncbi:MAG: hypothetical protein AB1505_02045 [Candidatus Latescibacterota bacterium]
MAARGPWGPEQLPENLRAIFQRPGVIDEYASLCDFVEGCFARLAESPTFRPLHHYFFLDMDLLAVAVASAIVDLERIAPFHAITGGPADVRRGAYVGYWLARWRPVQLGAGRRHHADLLTINEHLATVAALGQLSRTDCLTAQPGSLREAFDTIFYGLCWEHFTPKALQDALALLSVGVDD